MELLYRARETNVADQHDIHVALRRLASTRGGAIDERGIDLVRARFQCLRKNLRKARRLAHHAGQFLVHGTGTVGTVGDLVAARFAQQDTGLRELAELLVERPRRGGRQPGDFAHVIGRLRMQQQQSQHAAPVVAKEGVGKRLKH